jgi:hypothetical protein
MRRLTRLLAGAAVIVTTAALLGACGSDDDPAAGSPVLPARTVEADEVIVEITPAQLDADGAVFDIAFDTHSVDLSVDVAAAATLVVDGTEWDGAEWDGAGAGGHHREGRLRFRPGGDPTGPVELTITGLPDPVRATWDLDGE